MTANNDETGRDGGKEMNSRIADMDLTERGDSSLDKVSVEHGNLSTFNSAFNKIIWHGGSVYDAWLNAVSAQVGQVILSMPTSYAQMGFGLGIFFHSLYTIIGLWTCYLLARLYVEYRSRHEKEGVEFRKHVIQYHEVIGYLVAPWAQKVTICFNIMAMGSVAAVQIIACGSNAYYLNPSLDKQQWSLIFGAVAMFTVLLPSVHNFRVFSILGVVTTTYTAWYMFLTALTQGQVKGVKYSAPRNLEEFFTGTTNILFATGGHAITIEIMHAMWKPRKYKYVYLLNCIFVLTITMPHCITLYWAKGDILLTHNNAFSVLPASATRSTGLIFMIIHQAVAFGLYVMPLYFMWEKLWGIHQAWFPLRVVMRIPVAALLWFLAIALPFFGPLNSIIGSCIMSFNTFIIPCLAFLYVFRSPQARQVSSLTICAIFQFVSFIPVMGCGFVSGLGTQPMPRIYHSMITKLRLFFYNMNGWYAISREILLPLSHHRHARQQQNLNGAAEGAM